MKTQKIHTCRYCGHEGMAKGQGAELVREQRNYGGLYACKDAEACGERIRMSRGQGSGVRGQHDDLPF